MLDNRTDIQKLFDVLESDINDQKRLCDRELLKLGALRDSLDKILRIFEDENVRKNE